MMQSSSPSGEARVAAALFGFVSDTMARARGRDDVSIVQVSVLSTLQRTGPRRVTDLAVTENVTQSAMTKIATSLQAAGLVDRRPDPADGRAALVTLTAAGRRYLANRITAAARDILELIDQLPEQDRASLVAAAPSLERLNALSHDHREPSAAP